MTQTPVTAPSTQDPPQRLLSGKKRVLASAFAGTTIEWYDFYLYGTAAALIFNVQFFPSNSELGSLLASFATLAVGFFARPLGGIVAGHLGDRVGRKALLVVSLLCMGTASTLIGLVPNFDAIGWWAAVSLVVLRIAQGLSAGAEWGGSALLSVEHAPARKRGLFGSFTQIGSAAGMLLATSSFFLVQSLMSDEAFESFGWRIPFLASALLVALGLWIRLGVSDAPEFQELKDSGKVAKAPLREVLTAHPRVLLITIGLRLAQNSVFYLITVYMLSYLSDNRGDSTSGVTAVMIASAVGLVTGPAWGWVSDRIGRKPVTIFGLIGIAVFGWIFFAFLDSGPLGLLPLVVILGMNLAHDAVYGPQAAWFAEQFPIEVRYSGVNMGYQLGTVIGGGIMPMVAALLYVAGGHSPWLICGYLTLLCVLSLIAAIGAKDPARALARTAA
ncbi:MFS transporter [Brevibacterium linens]|jgi:metabolite-proton symporter|uniref:MHS family MFS transporter n=1 Tax=Brevibacterium epidermidis TaxID=1698 RepID=A0A9D2UPV5_BREEP|nr:MHS family MFS transporter [Brevibacterium sp.]HJE78933.1 MHS family MFS transporter [Brevibacterium epidermidis]